MRLTRIALIGLGGWSLCTFGQSWDTTGNGLLNGNYYFREVIVTASEALSVYGNITFSGSGSYTISAQGFDCNTASCSLNPYQATGTYAIAASGFGYLSNGLLNNFTFGSVGVNGVFVGSSTESGYNDLFIAAPISGQGTATLNGSYSMAYLEPAAQVSFGALMQLTANGSGSIGNVNLAAYATSPTPTNQTIGGVKYYVSNNAFVLEFPNSQTALLTGNEYLYSTPDGSFVFGGSPQDFDMIAGVRTTNAGTASLNGLYFEAGMDVDNSQLSTEGAFIDTFYGSLNAANSTIVGHQQILSGSTPTNYVYHDAFPSPLTGTYTDTATSRQYLVANGIRIGIGLGPYPSVSVGVQAQPLPAASGVYLNPRSVLNAASDAPFTSGISRGELLTLTGSNIGPSGFVVPTTLPLPTTLGGVQVLINGRAAPILDASLNQITTVVPYGTTTSVASVQVSNKGNLSNIVSTLVNTTTPGVFTNPLGGVNRATARHANGTLVTPANPAKIGETVLVYLTGLGDVYPNVADGAAGPASATPINPFNIYIDGILATPSFLGLAPGLAALYEMKVAIPAGVTAGDVDLDVAGPDSYSSQALISVSTATATNTPSPSVRRGLKSNRPVRPLAPKAPVHGDRLIFQ